MTILTTILGTKAMGFLLFLLQTPSPAAGSSAGNCQATATWSSCRWAYSTATLVLPAPPRPHRPTTLGPAPSPPVSRASSPASSSARPARNTGRGASRSTRPAAAGPADRSSRFACLSSSPWIPVLSPWISPFRSLNSAGRTAPATSSRNARTSGARAGSCRSDRRTSGMLVRSSATAGCRAHRPAGTPDA